MIIKPLLLKYDSPPPSSDAFPNFICIRSEGVQDQPRGHRKTKAAKRPGMLGGREGKEGGNEGRKEWRGRKGQEERVNGGREAFRSH